MAAKKETINIHGKEYETVASRIQRFWEEHPDYGLTTEVFTDDADPTKIMVKASIANEQGRIVATGHAEEIRSSSGINSTSALEVCETSSLGRALACFSYGGTEFASADEMTSALSHQADPGFHTTYIEQSPVQKIIEEKLDSGIIDTETLKELCFIPSNWDIDKDTAKAVWDYAYKRGWKRGKWDTASKGFPDASIPTTAVIPIVDKFVELGHLTQENRSVILSRLGYKDVQEDLQDFSNEPF